MAQVQARKIRILAVDHNPLLREGLRILIQLQPDMELVAVAASGKEAVQVFTEHRPDVTLMDLDLPHAEGIAGIQEILRIDPSTCVLGSMTYEEDESCKRALRAGAKSWVTKDRLNQDLVPLIRDHVRHDETNGR
jgi:DNA-binding NarL/FixJ family response regulator